MRRASHLATAVIAIVFAFAAPSIAGDQHTANPEQGFRVSEAIDHAFSKAVFDERHAGLGDDGEVRRAAASALAAPTLTPTAEATGPNVLSDDEGTQLGTRSGGSGPGDWLVGGFDTTSRWVTAGLGLGLATYLATADDGDIAELGDITQLLPAAAALGVTIGTGDWQGLKQLGLTGGTSFVLTHGIKETTTKLRPDASTANSFPSGHTSASVTGAAFLWRRYGAKWGAPASLFAAYTGISRVIAERHFADDVVSGMAVGLISSWLFTDPIDERAQVALFPTQGGAALQVSLDLDAPRPTSETPPASWHALPRRTFVWEIGGASVVKNDAISPSPGGTPVDFQFTQENNPTTTAVVGVVWSTENLKHDLHVFLAPFEIREVFEVGESFDFAGRTLAAGLALQSRYLAYDYRAGYSYAMVNNPRFRLSAGASIAAFDTELALRNRTDGTEIKQHVLTVRPTADLTLESALSQRWLAFMSVAVWPGSDVRIVDATAQLAYRLSHKWALSLGYRRVERRIDTDELFNDVNRNQITLGVWYFW